MREYPPRATRETSITATLVLDGSGKAEVKTGLGFLDHMLECLSRHARFDLSLKCEGDLHVDDHHTAEDCALVLGQALDRALGERRGVIRFGWAYAPVPDRKSTRLNSSHSQISYAVFCLKKKTNNKHNPYETTYDTTHPKYIIPTSPHYTHYPYITTYPQYHITPPLNNHHLLPILYAQQI